MFVKMNICLSVESSGPSRGDSKKPAPSDSVSKFLLTLTFTSCSHSEHYLCFCQRELSKTTRVQFRPPPAFNDSPPGFCSPPLTVPGWRQLHVLCAGVSAQRSWWRWKPLQILVYKNLSGSCSAHRTSSDRTFFYWEESHPSELWPQTRRQTFRLWSANWAGKKYLMSWQTRVRTASVPAANHRV